MIHTKSIIISNEQVNKDCWRITLDSPRIASDAKPGQFVNVKIREGHDPLLRRPFSVSRCIKLDTDTIGFELIYKVVGRGTHLMTNLVRGDELDIIGPLGRGFDWQRDKGVHILLAGGIGSAGLLMLGDEISKRLKEDELELYVLLGAETKDALLLEKEFGMLGGKVLVSTDDGTYGHKGFVTELLKDSIDRGEIPRDCALYACGPEPMLKSLAPICQEYQVPAQISIERHMMCGFGGCFNCVCKVDKNSVLTYRDLTASHIQFIPEEEFGYALVCKDGPVFHIEEVLFDE